MAMDREEAFRWMCEFRGITEPCKRCGGAGVRAYSSTATWHGGVGGAAITSDVCDACWGTGDIARKGVDLRALMAARRDWEAAQCAHWLSRRAGAAFDVNKRHLLLLADVIEAESRRRKPPVGAEDMFWYARSAESLAAVVRELCGMDESARKGGG